ncbi:LysR family transcriptional regulator [Roseibium sp.]|uniref:LysR family transcriptional regulator n=1 Tax=Roseibium sp. TaxID=1936156 RepID=UPI003D1397D8
MRLTNFDMDALRTFATGIDLGSFTRAAARLGRSTSAVSAQLKKLEDQAGARLVEKVGRGLVPTPNGELLLSYARRILALNDEAVEALRGADLHGWVRLGLQEDFGAALLPRVLGRFARSHPKVQIEGRIGRNSELISKISSGELDLAIAWAGDEILPFARHVADVPMCWLGADNGETFAAVAGSGDTVALAALEAPCLFRTIACDSLDRQGRSWRLSFASPGLAGLGAAVSAGLGITVRTPIGLPAGVKVLEAEAHGLPVLPGIGLQLLRGSENIGRTGEYLASILLEALQEILPAGSDVGSSVGPKGPGGRA